MNYRIEWETNIGPIHVIKPEDEVMDFCATLSGLNLEFTVTME